MHQFATQSITDIHHASRVNSSLLQSLDDVSSCLRFELSLQNILPSAEVGLGFAKSLHQFFAATLASLLNLVVIDGLFPLQKLQAHISRTQVSANTDKVGRLRSTPQNQVLASSLTNSRNTDGEASQAGSRVSTHNIDAPLLTSQSHSRIEFLDVFHLELAADSEAYSQLFRPCIHRENVAQIHHNCLVTKVSQGNIGEIEMNTLHQKVSSDDRSHPFCRSKDGTIVTYSLDGGLVLRFYVFCEAFNKTKLAQFRNLHKLLKNETMKQ